MVKINFYLNPLELEGSHGVLQGRESIPGNSPFLHNNIKKAGYFLSSITQIIFLERDRSYLENDDINFITIPYVEPQEPTIRQIFGNYNLHC